MGQPVIMKKNYVESISKRSLTIVGNLSGITPIWDFVFPEVFGAAGAYEPVCQPVLDDVDAVSAALASDRAGVVVQAG